MANSNTPFGLQLVRGGSSYAFNGQGDLYSIPSSDTNAYYINDVVKVVAGSSADGVPNVVKITNGTDQILGVVQQVLPARAGPSLVGTSLALQTSAPATKTVVYFVTVNTDLTSVYMAQDDGITTANLVAASANLNSSLTIAAPAAVNMPSATVLLSSSFANTSTLCVKLQGLMEIPGNEYGAYAKWQCRINVGTLTGSGTTGA